MRTIKANTKANGDILPEPQFKRIPVRVDKNTIILVREGLNVEEHLKRFKEKGNIPTGIYPVVLKKLQFVWYLKRAINID